MRKNRFYILPVILCSMLMLTGCPDSEGGSTEQFSGTAIDVDSGVPMAKSYNSSVARSGGGGGGAYRDDYASESWEESSDLDTEDTGEGVTTVEDNKINLEMLVYSGRLRIKTDTFNESVAKFKADIVANKGFIEHQELDTGWNMYDTRRDIQTFSAVVRIPSSTFATVMDGAETYGKVIESSTDVENIAREYAGASASLEVYEAKYQRYLELLKQANGVTEMVELEREITNIEREMSVYRSQLEVMDTDLAYSTLNVTISNRIDDLEVAEDTFVSRVGQAFKDSIRWFLRFLENLIIWIILYWWYIAFFILVVLGIRFVGRKWRAKHPRKPVKMKVNLLKKEPEDKDKTILKPDEFEGKIDNSGSSDSEE